METTITKHTPGHWASLGEAIKNERYTASIMRGDVAPLSTNIVARTFGNTKDEAEANAKLIAAAPESLNENIKNLEFLEWLTTQDLNLWSDKRQLLYERIAKTKELIKKATE